MMMVLCETTTQNGDDDCKKEKPAWDLSHQSRSNSDLTIETAVL